METDVGSEGFTCGWGYNPLYDLPKFGCISYNDEFYTFN